MATEKRLIDANVLMEHLDNCIATTKGLFKSVCVAIKCFVEQMPTVDAVEVVHSEWIHCQGKSNLWYCHACGEKILYNPTRRTYNIAKRPVHEVNKYCRGCGAKMDGERRTDG